MDLFNKSNNSKVCEMCGEIATNLCLTFLLNLCDSCFKIIHSMKLSSQHKKEIIDHFAPIDIKCPDHPKVPLNLFCVDENGKIYPINIIIY